MLGAIKDASPLDIGAMAAGLFLLYHVHQYLTVGAARRKIIAQNGCKPPNKYPLSGPYGLRLLLQVLKRAKEGTILNGMRERHLSYGNTLSIVFMGENAITTCEPENVKTVLSLKFRDFELPHLRLIRFGPFLGAGIFVVNGAHWEHSRAMLRPSFTRAQVADLDIFERHVSEVIDAIPKDGSMVDLQQLFFDLTLDTSTEFLFGESANTLVDRMAGKTGDDNFSDSFTNCMQWIGDRIRLGYFVGRQGDKYRRSHKFVHDFADRYVQQALEHHRAVQSGAIPDETEKADGRYVFLWELAKQTQDPVVLRSEALNILLAGRDTTASLLSCLWHILSRRPDVWTKLLAEVDQLEERRPTFEEMKSMKYLRFCLNETLRIHPVVPANNRVAVRDTVLPRGGGPDGKSPIFVKKGQSVQYNVYSMHRREDLYGPDAAEFKPERWETIRPGWEYLPFNGGPRICLGQQFALAEASYTTIRLMQRFRTIETRDPNPFRELLTVTLASYHGAKVSLQ